MFKNNKILYLIIFILIIFVGWEFIDRGMVQNPTKEISRDSNTSSIEENDNSQNKIIHKIKGIIKKEKIPQELELGEYWYWIYLDEPLLIENNSLGIPMHVEKIQLANTSMNYVDMTPYLVREVEVSGSIGWGYAESNVFNVVSVSLVE
jgi:hypothetical protein